MIVANLCERIGHRSRCVCESAIGLHNGKQPVFCIPCAGMMNLVIKLMYFYLSIVSFGNSHFYNIDIAHIRSQHTRDVIPMLVQSWGNVCDAGPVLNRHRVIVCRGHIDFTEVFVATSHIGNKIVCFVSIATENYISTLISSRCTLTCSNLNPLTAKLFNLNFHSLEVVSR